MEITRKADMKTIEGPADYFTGRATIKGQFQRPEPSRVSGAIVHFEPGARTAWHTHPAGQTLIVTEGVGWTQAEGEAKLEFHAGDVMWCRANRKHWHGATPDVAMTHIAIQESVDGSPVTWMEKVTKNISPARPRPEAMPHVIVKLWPGKTEAVKQELTEAIVRSVTGILNYGPDSVSVDFEEVPPNDWDERVFEPDILGKWNTLTKQPGYGRRPVMEEVSCAQP